MTKREKAWDSAVRDLCCIVCITHLRIDDTPCEAHHILEGGQRKGEMFKIGLCPIHHRQGTAEHPSRHSLNGSHGGLALFEKTYGPEEWLLDKTIDLLNWSDETLPA